MGDRPIVTLLTDFGTADNYVAEMKAAMLAVEQDLQFVDITHGLGLGDVWSAQYLLSRTWRRFPRGTVHLAVVDPGVGTSRRAIAAAFEGHSFVAPDNGILTPILPGAEVVGIEVPQSAAPTFHGRDVFAPAGARLAVGTPLLEIGQPFAAWHDFPLPVAKRELGALVGTVVYVDRFGTLVTNLRASEMPPDARITVEGVSLGFVRRTFGEVESGELVPFIGSSDVLEIAVRDGSAAEVLGFGARDGVRVSAAP